MSADDAPALRDHWWPRPGWRPGRLTYTWHLTFEDATALHDHVRAYQAALPLLDLHLIPPRWLHLTVQALGYVDEISDSVRDDTAAAVKDALAQVPAFDLTFGRPVVVGEGLVMSPIPAEPVRAVRHAIRAAIGQLTGENPVRTGPEQANGFQPHVSIAYAGADHDATPYAAALDSVAAEADTTRIRIGTVSFIRQERLLAPHWLYRWTTVDTAELRG